MPNVSFETRVLSVELVARVSDISEETAKRIKDFINAEIGKTDSIGQVKIVAPTNAEWDRIEENKRLINQNPEFVKYERIVLGMMMRKTQFLHIRPNGLLICIDQFLTPYHGRLFGHIIAMERKGIVDGMTIIREMSKPNANYSLDEVLEARHCFQDGGIVLSYENAFVEYVIKWVECAEKYYDRKTFQRLFVSRGMKGEEANSEKCLSEETPETTESEEKPTAADGAKEEESIADKKEHIRYACPRWMWEMFDELCGMIENAEANPETVEMKWLTAGNIGETLFGKKHNAYKIGNVLGHCVRGGLVQRRKHNGKNGYNEYLIPIPKKETTTETDENTTTETDENTVTPINTDEVLAEAKKDSDTVADRLREYRERSGLSIADVADLIKYPESVIKIWEAGENVPSREGKAQLESLFGKHIFDGVQKPVIW